MKNFDDTDLIALAVIGLSALLFWLGKDIIAIAIVSPVIGFYFAQKQSLKISAQNGSEKKKEEPLPPAT